MALNLFPILDTTFGSQALADALFYQHSPALRFQLAGGETNIAQFLQAIDRARAVLDVAFAGAGEVSVFLRVWDDETPAHLWQPQRLWAKAEAELRALGIAPPAPEHRVQHIAGNDAPYHSFAFPLSAAQIPKLLWGICAADLGITPSLSARLSLAAPELGVLACPYDSRGMDVTGPNVARLTQLYRQFDGWLLDYDRPRMAELFGEKGG